MIQFAKLGDSWCYRFVDTNSFLDSIGWQRGKSMDDAIGRGTKMYRAVYSNSQSDTACEPVVEQLRDDDSRLPRCPKLGGLNDTHGEIHLPGIEIAFGGACPVLGDGLVDGFGVYYRSRGDRWSIEIHNGGAGWEYCERCYAFPDGGYLHRDESISNIMRAIELFRKG